jgi:cyclic-di-AMP phosphodiesterase PgpH
MKIAVNARPGRLLSLADSLFGSSWRDPVKIIALAASAAITLAAVILFSPSGPLSARRSLAGFEAGKVADRDLTADRSLIYLDQAATDMAIRARESQVKPIYRVDEKIGETVLARFAEFRDFALGSLDRTVKDDTYVQALRSNNSALSREDAIMIRDVKDAARAFLMAKSYLSALFEEGIASIPEKGLDRYDQDQIEVVTYRDGKLTAEDMPLRDAITLTSWPDAIADRARSGADDAAYPAARVLVKAFIAENLFFDREQSEKMLATARNGVEPVTKAIAKGEKVVKKGYVVDEAQIQKIKALGADLPGLNVATTLGVAGFIFLLYLIGVILMGARLSGMDANRRDYLVVIATATLYFALAVFASRLFPPTGAAPFAVMLPSALVAILVSILYSPRVAAVFSFLISFSLLGIDGSGAGAASALLAFFSGIGGIISAQNAEKRIDLVKAGLFLALFQAVAVLILEALTGHSGSELWQGIFWAAFNGFFCGVLAIGFLPVLEGALNAPTRFRLMELSDLNSPLLKRLLTVAPGTYSHSVMVANLAESACRDIGADAILARVASYYHDVGKMDQPDYFVENQTSYNKHNELKPRLSATVIRSHVKLGVEKARAMRLPNEIVEIISQHHGNGCIAYFYNQALKEEGHADIDDFCYPGSPPKSKEAAVVMLADSVEAASRTLKKPTLPKLEQFVDEIIMDKFRQGLLADSELTFRDLETIKNSFVKILGGHYHSRIEYPKAAKEGPRNGGQGGPYWGERA